tara:strand:+ start:161 stop:412 length:252 start_codon:yes stop_codon:yes gene_type:complete
MGITNTCKKCDYVICVCKPFVNKPDSSNEYLELETILSHSSWEEIPEEELWEDGELNLRDVEQKILLHVLNEGDWLIVRRINK